MPVQFDIMCVCAEITDRLNSRTGNEGWERNTENEIKRKRPRKQISSAVREWPRSPISHRTEAYQLRLTTHAHTHTHNA